MGEEQGKKIYGNRNCQTSFTVSRTRDYIQGPDISLVEYGDYECPYCGQAYIIIKQIQQLAW